MSASASAKLTVGVLALQGGFAAHEATCRALGHEAVQVRCAAAFDAIDALILPGGESSTQLRLLAALDMDAALARFVASGRPVLATCAGAILAARSVRGPAQRSFAFVDVAIARNAYGRQLDSFAARSDDGALPLVFIRAPKIFEVGPRVAVLATHAGDPVLVREHNVTLATFHPELTSDLRVHEAALLSAA